MASTYYVYPGTGNDANAGTGGWASNQAWATIQKAFDTATIGDIVYCRGTETLAATVDVDATANAGTNAGGFGARFIGVNATTGNVDGSRYIINCNGGAFHGLTIAANMDMLWLENIRIYNTSAGAYDGVNMAGSCSGWQFINCSFDTCGRYGFNGVSGRPSYSMFFRCCFYGNGSHGAYYTGQCRYLFCSFHDNTGCGASTLGVSTLIGCLAYGNTDDQINAGSGTLLYNCVISGNTDGSSDDGVVVTSGTSIYPLTIVACRITNCVGAGDIGLNDNSEPVVAGYNYFDNNATDIAGGTAPLFQFIPVAAGTTSNLVDTVGETAQGYTSTTDGSEDFNLNATATYRRQAITIPIT